MQCLKKMKRRGARADAGALVCIYFWGTGGNCLGGWMGGIGLPVLASLGRLKPKRPMRPTLGRQPMAPYLDDGRAVLPNPTLNPTDDPDSGPRTSMTIVPSAMRMRPPGFIDLHSLSYETPITVCPPASLYPSNSVYLAPTATTCARDTRRVHAPACTHGLCARAHACLCRAQAGGAPFQAARGEGAGAARTVECWPAKTPYNPRQVTLFNPVTHRDVLAGLQHDGRVAPQHGGADLGALGVEQVRQARALGLRDLPCDPCRVTHDDWVRLTLT